LLKFINHRVDAGEFTVPPIPRLIPDLLVAEVVEQFDTHSGVEVSCVLLPQKLVPKLFSVLKRCALNSFPNRLQRKKVVPDIRR
jgi:hypothetical protein